MSSVGRAVVGSPAMSGDEGRRASEDRTAYALDAEGISGIPLLLLLLLPAPALALTSLSLFLMCARIALTDTSGVRSPDVIAASASTCLSSTIANSALTRLKASTASGEAAPLLLDEEEEEAEAEGDWGDSGTMARMWLAIN